MRSSDFHFLIDIARTHIQRTAENARESKHVVDLVREIAATCAYNFRTGLQSEIGHNLRHRVRHW